MLLLEIGANALQHKKDATKTNANDHALEIMAE
jgi:hypothetical protein